MTKYHKFLGGITLRNAKKIVAIAIIGIITVAFSGCNMIEKTQAGINNTVLATVNGEKITVGQLEPKMKSAENQLEQQYGSNYASNSDAETQLKQDRQQMLDQLVNETLLLQKAKTLKLVPSESTINAQLAQQYTKIKSQYKKESDWQTALSQNGYTDASLKTEIRNSVIIQKVTDYMNKNVKVTDKQIQDYYNANQYQFTQQANAVDTIHLAHILVKTQAEAQAIKAQLDKGADFGTLAKQNSTDGSAAAGGDLGTYDQANDDQSKTLDATFMKAALQLKTGQISDPVHTQFGWHIIKCVDRKDYPVKKLSDVSAQIKQTLLTQVQQAADQKTLAQWKKEAKITEYSDKLNY
jgi:foldase protein PrsA